MRFEDAPTAFAITDRERIDWVGFVSLFVLGREDAGRRLAIVGVVWWFQQKRVLFTRRVESRDRLSPASIGVNASHQLTVFHYIYMGKRKKSSRKPAPARKQKEPLGNYGIPYTGKSLTIPYTDNEFTCLFCHHDKSVTVRIERKDGVANLVCKVCDQRYQGRANRK